MAAGCAEARATEAGVRTPRSVLAFQPPKGVKREADKGKGRQPGEQARLGETLSLDRPLRTGELEFSRVEE
jgi:hypothetical protein